MQLHSFQFECHSDLLNTTVLAAAHPLLHNCCTLVLSSTPVTYPIRLRFFIYTTRHYCTSYSRGVVTTISFTPISLAL